MNLDRLGHYTQIISGIFLIIGVVLVVLQLRQTEALTRAQLLNEAWAMRIQQAGTAAGENPMKALAKLCTAEPLTDEDAFVVHNVFLQRLFLILRARTVNESAGFDDAFWKQEAQGNLGFILGTERGQAWIRTWGLPGWFMELVDEHEATFQPSCANRHPAIRALTAANSDNEKATLALPQ